MDRLVSLLGIFVLLGIATALSKNRKAIDWKLVAYGIMLQFIFAILVLKTPPGRKLFEWLNQIVIKLLDYTNTGSRFIFGEAVMDPVTFGGAFGKPVEFVFAVQVLPTIIFFSALMSILYYMGVMQRVVEVIAKTMVKLLGTSGAETLSASANIFVGQTEAPLLIKPYVDKMTNSELMVVMTGGFATVAGGVMAAYVSLLVTHFPDIAGHLMAASLMSAPAALVMAKILVPETDEPETKGAVKIDVAVEDTNVIEAAASGASVGLTLALNVGAMLLAFIALINLADGMLSWIGGLFDFPQLTFSYLFGRFFAPLAWVMGVPYDDIFVVGELFGKKLIINEFVAYLDLANLIASDNGISGRSLVICTYALCGFANFSSIGIQIGGIGGIAPRRKSDLARLGVLAVIGGTLACFQTATIAGVLVSEDDVKLLKNRETVTEPAATATPAMELTPSPDTEAPEDEASGYPQTPTPAESPEETSWRNFQFWNGRSFHSEGNPTPEVTLYDMALNS